MSKTIIEELWNRQFPNKVEAYDYAGRKILKSAIGDPNSKFHPTIDHIKPLAHGGSDNLGNLIICNRDTNAEKADSFPTWNANGQCFQANRVKGQKNAYTVQKF